MHKRTCAAAHTRARVANCRSLTSIDGVHYIALRVLARAMAAAPAANSSTTGCRRCTALSCKDRLDWEATTVTAATVDTAPLCTIYSIPTPRVGYSRAELQYSLQWSCGQGRACGDCAAHESNRFGDAVAPLCKRPTDRSVCSTQRGQQWHDTTVAAHNSGSSGSIQQWQHTTVA